MTSEMFQRKLIEFVKEGRDRISKPEDIGVDEIKKFVAIIKEFVSDLDEELQNVVNGKMSNNTCLLVAACLEDTAKHIRSFEHSEDAVMYELAYKTFFEKQVTTMTIPKIFGEDE